MTPTIPPPKSHLVPAPAEAPWSLSSWCVWSVVGAVDVELVAAAAASVDEVVAG
ncbi:hypothetical protein [Levilactobacillus acidifarinae]|uniref:hypothetical protein n=1 Tax=Levilactobacillus acidifarinae TaxID=267364 RepID=UPI001649FE2F|nr:hypothetical protein [Levilactobacillus acidifarinae]